MVDRDPGWEYIQTIKALEYMMTPIVEYLLDIRVGIRIYVHNAHLG